MVLLSWQLSEGERNGDTYFPLFRFKAPIFPSVKKTKLDTVKPRQLLRLVKVFLISVTHSKKKNEEIDSKISWFYIALLNSLWSNERHVILMGCIGNIGVVTALTVGCAHADRSLLLKNSHSRLNREELWCREWSGLSLNGHLYKTDASLKRTPRVGPCLCLLPLFDSL